MDLREAVDALGAWVDRHVRWLWAAAITVAAALLALLDPFGYFPWG